MLVVCVSKFSDINSLGITKVFAKNVELASKQYNQQLQLMSSLNSGIEKERIYNLEENFKEEIEYFLDVMSSSKLYRQPNTFKKNKAVNLYHEQNELLLFDSFKLIRIEQHKFKLERVIHLE